jgi:predicted transcriptional regulator of viral defense system
VAEQGIDQAVQARVYLNRLANSGRIQKIGTGKYGGVSPLRVTDTVENVTDITDVTPSPMDGDVE